ncbi:TIGR01777 family oxidoreductase [Chloroflexota bacterium]
MQVIVTGGSGLIGRVLADSLTNDGHEALLLSRAPGGVTNLPDGAEAIYWDGCTADGWGDLVEGADAVVNLAGSSIAGKGLLDVRWTKDRKRSIYESRINAGQAVTEAIQTATNKPKVLIQSSAIGYYGPQDSDAAILEDTPPADDFLASLCVAWEESTEAVETLAVRRVVIRTGVVLSTDGGALPRQILPFRLFAGGPIGSGEQWYSWIHIADQIAAIRFLLDNEKARGPFNLTAPEPVTNKVFGQALGRVMKRPAFMPAPAFAFKAAFGEASTVLLDGQRVLPQRLLDLGFSFQFTEAEAALRDLLA